MNSFYKTQQQTEIIVTINQVKLCLKELHNSIPISLSPIIEAQQQIIHYIENLELHKLEFSNLSILNNLLSLVKKAQDSRLTGVDKKSIDSLSEEIFDSYFSILDATLVYVTQAKQEDCKHSFRTVGDNVSRMLRSFLMEVGVKNIKINHSGLSRGVMLSFYDIKEVFYSHSAIADYFPYIERIFETIKTNHKVIGKSEVIKQFIDKYRHQIMCLRTKDLIAKRDAYEKEDKERNEFNGRLKRSFSSFCFLIVIVFFIAIFRDLIFNFRWPFKAGTYTDTIWDEYYGKWLLLLGFVGDPIIGALFPHEATPEKTQRVTDLDNQINTIKQYYEELSTMFNPYK